MNITRDHAEAIIWAINNDINEGLVDLETIEIYHDLVTKIYQEWPDMAGIDNIRKDIEECAKKIAGVDR